MRVRINAIALLILSSAAMLPAVEPPKPFGPTPSPGQLRWHEMEFYGFIHFTVDTFTGEEWGFGNESEAVFNPTDFDADQIVKSFKEGGMKGVILTAKHHDGFCLWPTKTTEHSLKRSPWKGGKGDVVKEIAEACKRQDVKFGVYLSPWDRNRADYGKPGYVKCFHDQLRELLTGYGPIFEVWFDGANGCDGRGGDGWYGGTKKRRRIDPATYYRWPEAFKMIRDLQPDAHIHSDIGPDSRWGGNESGVAGDACWATVLKKNLVFPALDERLDLHGDRPGDLWMPAEMPYSIRSPKWFYHPGEDATVRSPQQLFETYRQTVGHGAALLLNLPPDRRGRIADADARSVREFHRILESTFAHNLAAGASLTANNTRGNDPRFAPGNAIGGKRDLYWATDDGVTTPELVLSWDKPVTFNLVSLREYLPLGQRIDGVALDFWEGNKWQQFAVASSIGNHRLILTAVKTTAKVRLRVTKAAACPAIAELGLYWHQEK